MNINELFQKILSSEFLNEENRTELKTQFDTLLNEVITTTKKEAEDKVRIELTEQFVNEKEQLIEAIDTKVEEQLKTNLAEFQDDIERYRDLEKEYAEKLVEAKKEMADAVKKDMTTLVERLDAFLEERLEHEFTELKEDIQEVQKLQFGRKIFEAVAETYGQSYFNTDEVAQKLEKATKEAKESKDLLESKEKEINTLKREKTLSKVLESLQGKPREVMGYILASVPTEKLEETYSKMIGRVLHESVTLEDTSNKQKENTKVLAEKTDESLVKTDDVKIVTGDKTSITESKIPTETFSSWSQKDKDHFKELAGII